MATASVGSLEKNWLVVDIEFDAVTVTVPAAGEPSASIQQGGWFNQGWGHSWRSFPEFGPTSTAPDPSSFTPAPPSGALPVPSPSCANWNSVTAAVSATQSAPAASNTVSSDSVQSILDAHNSHRENSSAPILTWSDEMASTAQQIAASCVYEHNTSSLVLSIQIVQRANRSAVKSAAAGMAKTSVLVLNQVASLL